MGFFEKKYDVLVASTIIESGLDIPSVNTLIVENAHEFGLAQLYQLRGRIGRERQKAFCYLFYPKWLATQVAKKTGGPRPPGEDAAVEGDGGAPRTKSRVSEDAAKRLAALLEFGELGSGFRLAMRDLEIRGAGELLGVRQHGFLNEVGLGLYCELLAAEIRRLKSGVHGPEVSAQTTLDIRVPASIPGDYLPDELERLNYYKKLLNADHGDLQKILAELEDLCGPAPVSVRNIVALMRLRKKASDLGTRSIHQTGTCLEIFFHPGTRIPPGAVAEWQARFPGDLEFLPSRLGDGLRIRGQHEAPIDVIEKLLLPLRNDRGKRTGPGGH